MRSKSAKSSLVSKPKKSTSDVCKKQQTSKSKANKSVPIPEPLPGTSGLNNSGYALNLESEDTGSDFSVEDDDQVKCCICDKWQPDALKTIADVTFVEWAECDQCRHWTHLRFCSTIRHVVEGSEFRCPHCVPQVSLAIVLKIVYKNSILFSVQSFCCFR